MSECEMVQRVAAALGKTEIATPNGSRSLEYYIGVGLDALQHDYDRKNGLIEAAARNAIEAMREPTKHMLMASGLAKPSTIAGKWRAMIDEALRIFA